MTSPHARGTMATVAAAATILLSLAPRPAAAAPQVVSKEAHHRWIIVEGARYDATQVTIKFDRPLYGKGRDQCPDGYEFAQRWGDTYCCPPGHHLEYVFPQGPTCVSDSGNNVPAEEMSFNASATFDITNVPFPEWMQKDLTERMTVQCGDEPPSKPADMHDGPPPFMLLPSVSSDPLGTFFEVMAANEMRSKQQRLRQSKIEPPPLPERSKKLLREPVPGQDPKVLIFMSFHKETKILNSKETIFGPKPADWLGDKCEVSFAADIDGEKRGFSGKDGEVAATATAAGWVDNTPPCSYPDFKPLPDRISNALQDMKQTNVSQLNAGAWSIYSIVGSDAFFGCVAFLNDALIYDTEKETVLSKSCNSKFGTPEYMNDPCCNRRLQSFQCCAEREIDVMRRRLVGVKGGILKPKCSTDKDKLAAVFLGMESYMSARQRIYDTEEGCIIQYKRDTDTLEDMSENVEECYVEIFGRDGTGLECRSDEDCTYTKRCLISEGDTQGTCALPKDNPTPSLQRCFVDKLPDLVMPVLKLLWGVAQNVPQEQFYQVFQNHTSRYTCEGPTGWKYQRQWDHENNEWIPANKTACLDDKACNYNSWRFRSQYPDDEAMQKAKCESDKLGGKFCGECWGENDCFEVSRVPTCVVAPQVYQAQQSEATCTNLGGTYDSDSQQWGSCFMPVPTGEYYVNNDTCYDGCFGEDGPAPGYGHWCVVESTGRENCRDTLSGNSDHDLYGYFNSYQHYAHRFRWGSDDFNKYAAMEGGLCIADWTRDKDTGQYSRTGPSFCPHPFAWEQNPAERPQGQCQHTLCFNATWTKADCEDWSKRPDDLPDNAHLEWGRSLKKGSGACVVNMWPRENLKSTCEDIGWHFYAGARYTDGEKYTQEQCDEGQCNIDPSLSKDECESARRCTKNCKTCQPAWGSGDSEMCFSDVVSQSTCSDRGGDWDSSRSVCKYTDKTSREDCLAANSTNTWIECGQFDYESCGGDEGHKGLIECRRERWGRCENKDKCESAGECLGFPNVWVKTGTYQYEVADSVCVFPFIANEWGDQQCNDSLTDIAGSSSGGFHDHVMRSPIGCVPSNLGGKQNEDVCTSNGGHLVARPKNREQCESADFMRCCPKKRGLCGSWQFNSYSQDECDKCGYQWEQAFTWDGGRWVPGKMSTLHWRDREYTSLNEWEPRIAHQKLGAALDRTRQYLEARARSRSLGCSFNRMTTAISQIACGCGEGYEQCGGVDTKITVQEEAFAGKDQDLGFGLFAFNTSLDPTAGGGITEFDISELSAQSLQNADTGSRRRLRSDAGTAYGGRRLAEDGGDVSCYTTVTNDDGVYVGQILGDCVDFSTSEDLQDGVELCLSVSADIPQDKTTFPDVDFALRSGTGDSATTRPVSPALDVEKRDDGQELCATVDEGGVYCPIRRVSGYSSETTSADTSCTKNKVLVEAVVEGKTVDDAGSGDSGGDDSGGDDSGGDDSGGDDGGGGDDEAGPAPLAQPLALTVIAVLLAITLDWLPAH